MGRFRRFEFHDAVYLILADPTDDHSEIGMREIERQRLALESYLSIHPAYQKSLVPVAPRVGAPEIAREMAEAGRIAGVGPMAAVAGTIAEHAVAAMLACGAKEAIVDNGGDLFLAAERRLMVGLVFDVSAPAIGERFAGASREIPRLALSFPPERLPCAICSSSARMGHSLSFGRANLATVVAASGSLADAAATALCNAAVDIEGAASAVEETVSIDGVSGALVVLDGQIIAAGAGIDLVRTDDPDLYAKVTAHPRSDFPT